MSEDRQDSPPYLIRQRVIDVKSMVEFAFTGLLVFTAQYRQANHEVPFSALMYMRIALSSWGFNATCDGR